MHKAGKVNLRHYFTFTKVSIHAEKPKVINYFRKKPHLRFWIILHLK